MDIVTVDGMVEHDFRHSIEDMLRLDQVDAAVERLATLVAPYSGPNGLLPPCFREARTRRVQIGGWERLDGRLTDYDRPGKPITAIGVTLADATKLGGPGPARGRLAPFVKTYYFSDDAYPFSNATRDDLLDGYSRDGFEWQGDYQAADATLTVRGLDDLHGAIVMLEARLLSRSDPDTEEIRAGTIGACLVAALIHRALRDTVRDQGVPRPLCVIAACDGVYPYFDAPVAGIGDDEASPADEPAEGEDAVSDGAASLLNLISRRPGKAMALTLGAEDTEDALRFDELAAADRLEETNQHVVAGALDLSAMPAPGADHAWDDSGFADHEPDPLPAAAGPSQAWWSEEILGARPTTERQAFDPTYDPPQPPAVRFRTWEEIEAEQQAAETEAGDTPVDEPAEPPASHSLRARIREPRVEPAPAVPGATWWSRLLAKLLRRRAAT